MVARERFMALGPYEGHSHTACPPGFPVGPPNNPNTKIAVNAIFVE